MRRKKEKGEKGKKEERRRKKRENAAICLLDDRGACPETYYKDIYGSLSHGGAVSFFMLYYPKKEGVPCAMKEFTRAFF